MITYLLLDVVLVATIVDELLNAKLLLLRFASIRQLLLSQPKSLVPKILHSSVSNLPIYSSPSISVSPQLSSGRKRSEREEGGRGWG